MDAWASKLCAAAAWAGWLAGVPLPPGLGCSRPRPLQALPGRGRPRPGKANGPHGVWWLGVHGHGKPTASGSRCGRRQEETSIAVRARATRNIGPSSMYGGHLDKTSIQRTNTWKNYKKRKERKYMKWQDNKALFSFRKFCKIFQDFLSHRIFDTCTKH
jgi:hypothetical protein